MTSPDASPRLGAWILLFGALVASAGHGLFLYAALTPAGWLPDFAELIERSGTRNALSVGWFLASIPLALLALVLRRPLQARGWLVLFALGAGAATAAAFALYAQTILNGPG